DLTSAIRKARREWSKSGKDRWCQIYKALRNDLKKEIRKGSRRKWREFVHTASEDTKQKHNEGFWTLSRWSRKKAGKPVNDPHLPALRRSEAEQTTQDNAEKAQILAERFFPPSATADTSDIRETPPLETQIPVDWDVPESTIEEVLQIRRHNKAPVPDQLPNEALKQCRSV